MLHSYSVFSLTQTTVEFQDTPGCIFWDGIDTTTRIENQANLDEKYSESSHTLPFSGTNASLRDTYTRLLSTAIYYY